MSTTRSSIRGLEWLNFFLANVQTGFGPFISAYLTSHAWTQGDIGVVLTISGIVSLVGQLPAGIIVDSMRSKKLAASVAVVAIAGCALVLAAWPIFPMVLLAEVLHGVASCLISPAIAAITVGLMETSMLSKQFGRNASFASVGAGIAAAAMGACGRLLSYRAVFIFTAILVIPALFTIRWIRDSDIDLPRARGSTPEEQANHTGAPLTALLKNKHLLIFAVCLMLFHLGNAAMLPLVASIVTMHSSEWATVQIAACIVVPQIVVALISPWVGRMSEQWGRKPMLLMGFAALPIRGILFSVVGNSYLLVATQVFDGVSAAVIGVLLPMVVADITRRSAHFNAALGAVGTAAGIGASISSTIGGYTIDAFGAHVAFLLLAAIATVGAIAI
ncbi:MAG TPA: MFS transporter, partial [Magnetospirillaceae bacterium]